MSEAELRLRDEIGAALKKRTGITGTAAAPFIDAVFEGLQEIYGGTRLYVPQRASSYDTAAIRKDLESRFSIAKVCRNHGLSRSTLYKLFPRGLPGRARLTK